MKVIAKLSEQIEEEIHDAEHYIKWALECKDERRGLADVLYSLSLEEMKHMNILHEQVTQIIAEYRRDNGEPPANMLAVYDYLHKKQIENANAVKMYQEQYKIG